MHTCVKNPINVLVLYYVILICGKNYVAQNTKYKLKWVSFSYNVSYNRYSPKVEEGMTLPRPYIRVGQKQH